jgi:septin family protein
MNQNIRNCLQCGEAFNGNTTFCSETCYLQNENRFADQKKTEKVQRDYELTEIEVHKLNLQPGETLMVTIKSDYVEQQQLQPFKDEFRRVFPNNEIFIFGMDSDSEIKFVVVNQSEKSVDSSPKMHCNNCNCEKKEIAQGNK